MYVSPVLDPTYCIKLYTAVPVSRSYCARRVPNAEGSGPDPSASRRFAAGEIRPEEICRRNDTVTDISGILSARGWVGSSSFREWILDDTPHIDDHAFILNMGVLPGFATRSKDDRSSSRKQANLCRRANVSPGLKKPLLFLHVTKKGHKRLNL